jgi:DNA-binding CsgD family transcriptional regulator
MHPTPDTALDRGRASYERYAWADAFDELSAVDREQGLAPEDLERLGTAAVLAGHDDASTATLTRAHQAYAECGNAARAARCAFWIAFQQLENHDHAQAGGWLSRAQRILDDAGIACVERGYLLIPQGVHAATRGEFAPAIDAFRRAATIGEQFGNADLVTLARHGEGRALIRLGRHREGVALLDEVMVGVTAGETTPVIAGLVYCSVLSACHECFDFGRAREWTAALTKWCASQPGLVAYRGQCLLHRAEIMQFEGAWSDAMAEARRASALLTRPFEQAAAGSAWYRLAELHRLRGEFPEAEAAYREASRRSGRPEPGLALLRLAQGHAAKALGTIRRMVDEVRDPRARPWVLAACVEIAIAADRRAEAHAAADELAGLAESSGAALLRALSAGAAGAVRLAEHDPGAALPALREAWSVWETMDAPYEAARVRVLIGLACRATGDDERAALELDAARAVFDRLRAAADLNRLATLAGAVAAPDTGPLTAREVEVLRHVAQGKTNRAIALDLGIAEKTVARHVANIFAKLGVTSRAAATAYAYEHGLR